MKSTVSISAAAVFFVAASRCFAVWDVLTVSKEQAKTLGIEVRSTAGDEYTQVVLEFKDDGKLKDFSDIYLKVTEKDKLALSVAVREDRTKPGRVVVGVTADAAQVGKLTFQVKVPYRDGALGRAYYEVRVKDLVEANNRAVKHGREMSLGPQRAQKPSRQGGRDTSQVQDLGGLQSPSAPKCHKISGRRHLAIAKSSDFSHTKLWTPIGQLL